MNLAPIVTRLRDQTGGAFREVGTAADFGVLLVVRSAVESARGGGTLDALEPLRDAVRAALHGWQPGAHLHMRCLDGVYAPRSDGGIRFARVKAPDREEPEQLVQRLAVSEILPTHHSLCGGELRSGASVIPRHQRVERLAGLGDEVGDLA